MDKFIIVIVTFLAGMGAGLGTGFAGMSAAVVIVPMLVAFLGVDHYVAVGIALASDVLASAAAAITYGKNKNIDIKHVLIMMFTALAFTIAGSFLGQLVTQKINWGEDTMSVISIVMMAAMGLKFIIWPITTTKDMMLATSKIKRIIGSIICGIVIGFICGFIGAGGGIMMLMMLTMILGYELKTAVGTSVFVMTFTALAGSVTHFATGGAPDWLVFGLCVGFTFIWAQAASLIANKAKPITLNRVVGIILLIFAIVASVFFIIAKVR